MQKEDLRINDSYFCHPRLTANHAKSEILEGLAILNSIENPIVTMYGSHKVSQDDEDFIFCQKVAKKLAAKKYAIATGGGTGIMLAANSTAKIMGADSIAFKGSHFVDEHVKTNFYTHQMDFEFIFARRFILSIKSDALFFFPGGYGTLNELFEILVLMQSGIIDKVPVILVRKAYWVGLFDWITEKLADGGMLTNDHDDVNLVQFVDTVEDAVLLVETSYAERKQNGAAQNGACRLLYEDD